MKLWLVVVLLASGAVPMHQVSASGSSVSGAVVERSLSGDDLPVRWASVELVESSTGVSHLAMTGPDGTFRFGGVSPGRYRLSAFKAAYLPTAYGSRSTTTDAANIEVTQARTVSGLLMVLTRGAVIAGTVRDERGAPVLRARVKALLLTGSSGDFEVVGDAGVSAISNDKGEYRLFGLPPATYVVQVTFDNATSFDAPPIHQVTTAEINQARAPQIGVATGLVSAPVPTDPLADYSPVFAPAGSSLARASPLALVSGQVREGVDVTASPMPQASLLLDVSYPGGIGPGDYIATAVLELVSGRSGIKYSKTVPLDRTGRTRIDGIQNGDYRVSVFARRSVDGPKDRAGLLWARTTVALFSQVAVSASLQSAIEMTGRLDLQNAASGVTAPRVTISAVPLDGYVAAAASQTSVAFGEEFKLSIVHGSYVLSAEVAGSRATSQSIALVGVVVNGVDATDLPFEIGPHDGSHRATVTFTTRPAELSGVVLGGEGVDLAQLRVIVFSPDRRLWRAGSKHIRTAVVGRNGSYSLWGLVPGEYALVVVRDSDVTPRQLQDPLVLSSWLTQRPVSIRIGLGERKTQDLKLAGKFSFPSE